MCIHVYSRCYVQNVISVHMYIVICFWCTYIHMSIFDSLNEHKTLPIHKKVTEYHVTNKIINGNQSFNKTNAQLNNCIDT